MEVKGKEEGHKVLDY